VDEAPKKARLEKASVWLQCEPGDRLVEGMSCKAKFFDDKEVAAVNEKFKGKEYNATIMSVNDESLFDDAVKDRVVDVRYTSDGVEEKNVLRCNLKLLFPPSSTRAKAHVAEQERKRAERAEKQRARQERAEASKRAGPRRAAPAGGGE